jgi:hypothetical protein
MKTPTVPALKKWARANKGLAKAVLKAKAFAEVERERVDAYVEGVFAKYEFYNDLDSPRNTRKGEKLTHSKSLYLSTDEAKTSEFYAECDRAHREHGFTGTEGHCPALEAESLLVEAENGLLDEVGKLMGLDGRDFSRSLELRAKTLDWALSVCLAKKLV